MTADLDDLPAPRWRVLLLVAGYLALWAAMAVLLGVLLLNIQLRQAEDDFQSQAAEVHHHVLNKLQANDAVLGAMAAFVGRAELPPEALEQGARALLRRFPHVFQVLLQQRVGANADAAYYPLTFVWPMDSQSQAVPGLDVQSLLHLREGLRRALATGDPAATGPFALMDGEPAYALFHPVFAREEPDFGQLLAALVVKTHDLLPDDAPAGLSLRLHYESLDGPLLAARGDPLPPARGFPRLRFESAAAVASQPFLLALERQLGWETISRPTLLAWAGSALLGLLLMLGHVYTQWHREGARLRSAQRLYRLANYDTLTGLPNRNLLHDRLQHAIARARRSRLGIAVLFLDLDGFKAVNDTAGHEVGDRLLVEVGRRLRDCVRDQDTVVRLSGDEFVILLEDVSARSSGERVMHQIQYCLEEPIRIGEFDFLVTASAGIAVFPEDGEHEAELLRKADAAMYAHKHPEWAAMPR